MGKLRTLAVDLLVVLRIVVFENHRCHQEGLEQHRSYNGRLRTLTKTRLNMLPSIFEIINPGHNSSYKVSPGQLK